MKDSPTRQWLEQLYGQSPGFFTVILFKDGKPRTRAFSTAELGKVAPAIEKAAQECDVYTSVATYKTKPEGGRRGSLPDVQSIAGWWADIDIGQEGHKPAQRPNPNTVEEALSIIEGLPEPTAVIHSGGGLQVWWLFDKPWVFDDPKTAQRASNEFQARLQKQAEELGYHIDSVGDLPRILRVPGTENHKTDNIRPVKMLTETGIRYSASELASIGVAEEDVAPPRDYNSWAAILEPHGWTVAGTRAADGATLWVRPGKTAAEGHSAVTDPYGVPVMVNFSGSAGLPVGPGNRLTKFKVWAYLNYGGDLEKAKVALEDFQTTDPELLAERAAKFIPLDWPEVFAGAEEPVDWLVEPLLERGRAVAFYSEAKQGKSLLWLELSAKMSCGSSQFGIRPTPGDVDVLNVVYLDIENNPRDIGEHLTKMGFTPDDLVHLHYYSFPSIAYLDTKAGGLDVLSLALTNHADVVLVDTLSRVVAGDENDNDTYNRFYTHTGVKLKANGIALVRLDHSGKDVSKGMRGASSKTTDVDEVWQMVVDDDETVHLKRTHTRSAHGDGYLNLRRRDDPVLHHDRDLSNLAELTGEIDEDTHAPAGDDLRPKSGRRSG